MRDNTINNYFAGAESKFLENLSGFQTSNFSVYKVLELNEVFEVNTPKNCYKYEIFAGAILNGAAPGSGLLLDLKINQNMVMLKLNDLTFPFVPLFPIIFDGVPYIQKNDFIEITGAPDVVITLCINFTLVIPNNT